VVAMESKKGPSVLVIASGKGGVGKTNLTLNLALCLQGQGRRTSVLDADVGVANIDVLLGLSPEKSLADFLEDRVPLEEVVLIGPKSLEIIPGGSALDQAPSSDKPGKQKLRQLVEHFSAFEFVLVDSPAGIAERVLRSMETATLPLLLVAPEPTSLTDAYSLLKLLCRRGNPGPVHVVVNMAKSRLQAEKVFEKLKGATDKFLSISINMLGYLLEDSHIREAVSQQKPFFELFPNCPASQCIKALAASVLFQDNGGSAKTSGLAFFSGDEPEKEGGGTTPQEQPQDECSVKVEPFYDIISLLLKEGYVSSSKIDYAQKIQAKLDTPKRLLTIVQELGYVNEEHIKEVLLKNRTTIRLGSLLVELGYITEEQLASILSQQRQCKGGKRIGELLVENNCISEYDLTQALSIHLGFPYVEPRLETMDRSLLEKASKHFFSSHRMIPLGTEKGMTKIAMADPLNSSAVEAAKHLFGPRISLSITMDRFVQEVLDGYEDSKGKKGRDAVPEKSEVVQLVDRIIRDALNKRASDIHIEPLKNRTRVRLRKDGSLIRQMELPKRLHSTLVSRIKIMASANIAEKRRHQDGRILIGADQVGEELDIRVSFYVTIFGEKVVLRLLTKKAELFKITDLGMGSKMLARYTEEVLETPSGVVIITGPTGAGKTTTLYASINYCNRIDTSIITAEDPVEYVIEGVSQCSIDSRIGVTFEETLRHILRQDPDIIILGEIRDKHSAESAIQAALTGHKVFTTFHTEDSIGGLLRLMNMDIETFLISSTVVCVVAQRLLKRVCPACKKAYVPNAKDLRRLRYEAHGLQGYDFQIGEGCEKCDFTGYSGRVAVFELLVLNEYVKEAIRQNKTSYEIRRISIETSGLLTLLEDGLAKAAKGITTIPEVLKQLPILETPRPLDQIIRLVGDF
jgi:type IV pilus assembly protein PilB